MIRKLIPFIICVAAIFCLSGCDIVKDTIMDVVSQKDKVVSEESPAENAPLNEVPSPCPYVAFISDGRDDNYWQAIVDGALQSAEALDVLTSFDVPPADAAGQAQLIKEVLAKNPSALCISAVDSAALAPLLAQAREERIPVLGIRNGIISQEEGLVAANIAPNPTYAGTLAADSLYANALFLEKARGASLASPVVIAVQISDTSNYTMNQRALGFIERMKTLLGAIHPGHVSLTGHPDYANYALGGTIINIMVVSPESSEEAAGVALAEAVLTRESQQGLIGYFCADEGSVNDLLSATNEGQAFNRASGIYGNVAVIGFDSGIRQKVAVSDQLIFGSVADNAYQTGYLAITNTYEALQGETIPAVINSGSVFYDKGNITNEEVLRLLND